MFGVRYINCGDWVESCTAVVEHRDGRFEIVLWTDAAARLPTPPGGRWTMTSKLPPSAA